MKFVVYTELAKTMGVSLRTICNWTKSGKLQKNEMGKVDVDLPHNRAFLLDHNAPEELFSQGTVVDPATAQQVDTRLRRATEAGLSFTGSEMIQEYLQHNKKAAEALSTASFSDFIKMTREIVDRIKAEADAGIRRAKFLELRGDTISLEIAIQINDEVGIQLDKMAQELPSKIVDRILNIAKNSETPVEQIKELLQITYSEEIQKAQESALQALKKASADIRKQEARNEPDNAEG